MMKTLENNAAHLSPLLQKVISTFGPGDFRLGTNFRLIKPEVPDYTSRLAFIRAVNKYNRTFRIFTTALCRQLLDKKRWYLKQVYGAGFVILSVPEH